MDQDEFPLATPSPHRGRRSSIGSSNDPWANAIDPYPRTRLQAEAQLTDYVVLDNLLGKGSFAEVYKGADPKEPSKLFAVKAIQRKDSKAWKLIDRECQIIARCEHPHIVRLFHVYEAPHKVFVLLELCQHGDLYDKLKELPDERLSNDDCRAIATQLAEAIAFLHQNDIAHRDIKTNNILIRRCPRRFCKPALIEPNATKTTTTPVVGQELADASPHPPQHGDAHRHGYAPHPRQASDTNARHQPQHHAGLRRRSSEGMLSLAHVPGRARRRSHSISEPEHEQGGLLMVPEASAEHTVKGDEGSASQASRGHGKEDRWDVCITDFGLAAENKRSPVMKTVCGTIITMAPEVLQDSGLYSPLCDIWSLGIVIYQMLTGKNLFSTPPKGVSVSSMYQHIVDTGVHIEDPHINPQAAELLEGMLRIDPAWRSTSKEVLEHPWITGEADGVRAKSILELMREFAFEEAPAAPNASDATSPTAKQGAEGTATESVAAEEGMDLSECKKSKASSHGDEDIPSPSFSPTLPGVEPETSQVPSHPVSPAVHAQPFLQPPQSQIPRTSGDRDGKSDGLGISLSDANAIIAEMAWKMKASDSHSRSSSRPQSELTAVPDSTPNGSRPHSSQRNTPSSPEKQAPVAFTHSKRTAECDLDHSTDDMKQPMDQDPGHNGDIEEKERKHERADGHDVNRVKEAFHAADDDFQQDVDDLSLARLDESEATSSGASRSASIISTEDELEKELSFMSKRASEELADGSSPSRDTPSQQQCMIRVTSSTSTTSAPYVSPERALPQHRRGSDGGRVHRRTSRTDDTMPRLQPLSSPGGITTGNTPPSSPSAVRAKAHTRGRSKDRPRKSAPRSKRSSRSKASLTRASTSAFAKSPSTSKRKSGNARTPKRSRSRSKHSTPLAPGKQESSEEAQHPNPQSQPGLLSPSSPISPNSLPAERSSSPPTTLRQQVSDPVPLPKARSYSHSHSQSTLAQAHLPKRAIRRSLSGNLPSLTPVYSAATDIHQQEDVVETDGERVHAYRPVQTAASDTFSQQNTSQATISRAMAAPSARRSLSFSDSKASAFRETQQRLRRSPLSKSVLPSAPSLSPHDPSAHGGEFRQTTAFEAMAARRQSLGDGTRSRRARAHSQSDAVQAANPAVNRLPEDDETAIISSHVDEILEAVPIADTSRDSMEHLSLSRHRSHSRSRSRSRSHSRSHVNGVPPPARPAIFHHLSNTSIEGAHDRSTSGDRGEVHDHDFKEKAFGIDGNVARVGGLLHGHRHSGDRLLDHPAMRRPTAVSTEAEEVRGWDPAIVDHCVVRTHSDSDDAASLSPVTGRPQSAANNSFGTSRRQQGHGESSYADNHHAQGGPRRHTVSLSHLHRATLATHMHSSSNNNSSNSVSNSRVAYRTASTRRAQNDTVTTTTELLSSAQHAPSLRHQRISSGRFRTNPLAKASQLESSSAVLLRQRKHPPLAMPLRSKSSIEVSPSSERGSPRAEAMHLGNCMIEGEARQAAREGSATRATKRKAKKSASNT